MAVPPMLRASSTERSLLPVYGADEARLFW